jgi:hypothetical protein
VKWLALFKRKHTHTLQVTAGGVVAEVRISSDSKHHAAAVYELLTALSEPTKEPTNDL